VKDEIQIRQISITKAEPIGDQNIPTLVINIFDVPPQFDSPDDAARWYASQAQLLERRLHGTLPGGTYDRLLGLMLTRKASLLKVAYGGLET